MGKASLFRWPFGWFMRWLGGIAVDRSRSNDLVAASALALTEAPGAMQLIVPPEGTRGRTRYWKTGFYYIAVAGVGTDAFADTGAVIWPDPGEPGQTVNGNEFLLHGWGGSGEVGEYAIRLQIAAGGAVPTSGGAVPTSGGAVPTPGGAVPAPSALALIGLGALSSRRRRL
jgi:hypothetical protein